MKIKTILIQHRRDFTATLECEHCQHEEHMAYPILQVIPNIECGKCGKKAPENYRPIKTKYREDEVV